MEFTTHEMAEARPGAGEKRALAESAMISSNLFLLAF
jgi:hypothetical protein